MVGVVTWAIVDGLFEVDGVAFGVTLLLGDWQYEVVHPGVCGVALVFSIVFVDVFEPLFVSRRLGALDYVGGGLGMSVVTNGGEQSVENAAENM